MGEAEGLAAAPQHRTDTDLGETPAPGYFVTNLKAGVRAGGLSFTTGMDNVFDRFYYERLSFQRDPFRTGVRVPEPGRYVYLNIDYRF